MGILGIVGIIAGAIVLWMVFDAVRGLLTRDAPRKPSDAGDAENYDYSAIGKAVWLIEHPNEDKYDGVSYRQTKSKDDGLFSWEEIPDSFDREELTEKNLLKIIRPAADYMAKRYDCSDFRAIWLCKLRYALEADPRSRHLLTTRVDEAIREALTGFKYWITSEGSDSMCYYSENHQMVFAVSEYLAGNAYPEAIFSIDGKKGSEHIAIATERLDSWFDQRGRYGFSEFLSSNYLAVDIGSLSMLRMYSMDEVLCRKASYALDMLFLDYALQMYDCAFTGPAGRNYARNNTSFMASTASHIIVDRVWNTGESRLEKCHSGFPYLFVSLVDSGKYSVPDAITELGRDNEKGVVKTSSGLTLTEMKQKNLIGLSDYRLMFQLGMGALSNEEVIENTLNALDRFKLTHNNFVSGFKFFNIRFLRYLGLTKKLSSVLKPFSNGMAIQRNEVYTYCCKDYKLSTNQMYLPGSFGAQQLQQMACLPNRINVFTANPMKRKEFQGYGIAPCAAQDMNCMLSIYNIPKGRILLATGDTRQYTSTYFPEEKFDEVIIEGNHVFGRIANSYIALTGASNFTYATYADKEEFEERIFNTYEFYEGQVGPHIDAFRLKDRTKGFDLRQDGSIQFTIYEMGSAENETFAEFTARVKENRVTFTNNVLSYTTRTADLNSDVKYVLDYDGSFTVNGKEVTKLHDRYDSRFVHTLRDDDIIRVVHGQVSCEINLNEMYMEP